VPAPDQPKQEEKAPQHLSQEKKSGQDWQRRGQQSQLTDEVNDHQRMEDRKQFRLQQPSENKDGGKNRCGAQDGLDQAWCLRIDGWDDQQGQLESR